MLTPQDLAAIFNGLSTSDQVEFLAEIKPNSFVLADEIAYCSTRKQEEQILETVSNLLLEYHLNFGTNRLVDGKFKDEAVKLVVTENDDINGIFFNGFFFSDDMEPFKAIDWTRVEVQHG